MNEEYVNKSGETVSMHKDGPYFYVENFDKEDNCRWTKMY